MNAHVRAPVSTNFSSSPSLPERACMVRHTSSKIGTTPGGKPDLPLASTKSHTIYGTRMQTIKKKQKMKMSLN
jgi:hypothetical protein